MRKYMVALIAISVLLVGALGISTSATAHSGDRAVLVKLDNKTKTAKVIAVASTVSCYTMWRYSGHTDYVNWYHCHGDRVHICSSRTAILHGITVWVNSNNTAWLSNHAHDLYGENCWYS